MAVCGWARVRNQPGSVQQVVGHKSTCRSTALGEGHVEGLLHTDVKEWGWRHRETEGDRERQEREMGDRETQKGHRERRRETGRDVETGRGGGDRETQKTHRERRGRDRRRWGGGPAGGGQAAGTPVAQTSRSRCRRTKGSGRGAGGRAERPDGSPLKEDGEL